MTLPSSPRYGFKPIWVTLHTAEGARTVESLYSYFDRNQNASSHAGADGYRLSEPWVPDDRAAWTLLNGNPRSLNLEMCGFARWTRGQWLSEGWVDGVWNPRQMMRNAASWARQKCDKYGIPRRLLTAAEVGQGVSGIIDHARYTYGTGDGDHTDIGAGFPWDVFFTDLNGATTSEEDDMNIWDIVNFRPNRGQNLFDGVEQIQLNQAAQNAMLATIATNKDVTTDALSKIVNDAVKANKLKPEEVAAALSTTLIPTVEAALRRVQDTDNVDEAKQTAAELLRLIASATPPNAA